MPLPTTFTDEKNRGYAWIAAGAIATLIVCGFAAVLTPIFAYMSAVGLSPRSLPQVLDYFQHLGSTGVFTASWKFVWNQHRDETWLVGSIFGMLACGPVFAALVTNPHRLYDLPYGDAKWADRHTVDAIEKEGAYSFKRGKHLHLGYFQGKPLKLVEGRSGAIYAPPGSGKTADIIVPCILASDETSMIVHDSKPELFTMTGGWRSRVGSVYVLDFSATDFVDPADYDNPERTRFYVTINPLDPAVLPPDTADRETAIDAMWQLLVPSSKGGGNSEYFASRGRSFGIGMTHYLVLKVNEYGDYSGIPERWHGKKASFPMLVDYIARSQMDADSRVERQKAEAAEAGRQVQIKDPISEWLRAIVNEAREWKDSERCVVELSTLVGTGSTERASVMNSADVGLLPFKNKAVAERMSESMLTPGMLRGEKIDGKWRPVTLYVCCNQAEAKAFATVTALIYDMFARVHCTLGPGSIDKRGDEIGPFNIYYLLDEFAQLPQIPAVENIAAVGRSMGCSIVISTQSESQFQQVYTAEQTKTQRSLMGFRVFLNQNDPESIELAIKMVGATSIQKKSRSSGGGKTIFEGGSTSTSIEKVDLIRPNDVSAMVKGQHIVLLQGFNARPLLMKSARWFLDPHLKLRGYNDRNDTGPAPGMLIPMWRWQQSLEQWEANPENQLKAFRYRTERDAKRRLEDPGAA